MDSYHSSVTIFIVFGGRFYISQQTVSLLLKIRRKEKKTLSVQTSDICICYLNCGL